MREAHHAHTTQTQVMLDVVLNRTAEGNECGPTISPYTLPHTLEIVHKLTTNY